MNYLFTSQRLGFRNWLPSDLKPFQIMNADPRVMEHFDRPLEPEETTEGVERLKKHYEEHGFTYFAVDRLDNRNFIGFIGMKRQNYPISIAPCIDIGWRLRPEEWGNGFATEGAKRCLEYAFNTLGEAIIVAVATHTNEKSMNVMRKAGMTALESFYHPEFPKNHRLQPCKAFAVTKEQFSTE